MGFRACFRCRPELAPGRADSEAYPLVDAFAEEHRAHADEQETLLAAVATGSVTPVDLGRDGDATRWGFPTPPSSPPGPTRRSRATPSPTPVETLPGEPAATAAGQGDCVREGARGLG